MVERDNSISQGQDERLVESHNTNHETSQLDNRSEPRTDSRGENRGESRFSFSIPFFNKLEDIDPLEEERNGNEQDSNRPLRENEDIGEIYETVSQQTSRQGTETTKQPREPSNLEHESPKIMSNPWSFFNRNADKQEQRYVDDEDENRDKTAWSDEENTELPEKPQGISNLFRNRGTHVDFDRLKDDLKFKSRLKKFRSKKKHSKKYSISAIEQPEEPNDDELATGERAQSLIARLSLGASAINLLASCLLEDEYGIARAPLLLSLIGFKITDTSTSLSTKIRRFRIDLEYGVGPQRLKWSVEKNAKDLLYLHSKFKFESWRNEVVRNKNSDLPKYPIPPLRTSDKSKKNRLENGERINNNIENEENEVNRQENKAIKQENGQRDASVSEEQTPEDLVQFHPDDTSIHSNYTFREHLNHLKAHLSNASTFSNDDVSPEQVRARMLRNQQYIRDVTKYLNDLISQVALKPQSNRLFQFFEISPISSLLSYETGYTGKQGVIHIGGNTKSQGWRVGHFKANDLKGMIDRRQEKWLLVRNSYVMYVSDINSTLPLEVFLVDYKLRINFKKDDLVKDDDESEYDDSSLVQKKLAEETAESEATHKNVFQHLKITLENTERKLVLIPKSTKEQKLWIKSLQEMKANSSWAEPNRFDSFAPVRQNCFAQWFVDGRDYFWAVSSALEMAKDVIFIHDWWLTPQLYLRRPANGNQQWRIDRILQRKAQQGVKIFVIVYRNVGSTVLTDSLYTKHSILSLNEENIHVIRSPNQLLQNTYFWAHHEKLCIVDQTVAFMGGIDLCYGRFDTPDHVIVDDSDVNFNTLNPDDRMSPEDFAKFQTFPGKDYSNPRVKDFSNLDKPYESMYDRNVTPRMPWHDVHMVTSGKVARDLARHFVQRWNYLIRQKRPSRFTPLLTPPADLTDEETAQMGLNGTCEVQLLRSSGNWSLGLKEHEQSIQNAYLKLIETSEHFVYIENQFFVTSCFIDGNEIHNRIGDALVDRIIKAHNEGTNWRAVIVIPLMPGFESQVDEPDGSSVRVIMQCQYMSISRGSTSIFAKLRKYGIEPDDYIQFFSLRKWGRIGPERTLVTEQLYIHAKTMIVDDKIAIIGSANINERSMRGFRDSEIAAVTRDKATVHTFMDGEPYLAGKFAHTLRMRLMREHLGVNVDILDIVERRFKKFEEIAKSKDGARYSTSKFRNTENTIMSAMVEIATRDILDEKDGSLRWKHFQKAFADDNAVVVHLDDEEKLPPPLPLPISFNNRTGTHEANKGIRDKKKHSYDARVQHSETHRKDAFGNGIDKYKTKLAKRARLNSGRFLKDLSQKKMKENPKTAFIPDLENVCEFLDADDFSMHDEMDEESETIISERNRERWQLLKKISYLQRVAAKEKEEQDEESKKRVAAGLEQTIHHNIPVESSHSSSPEIEGKVENVVDVPTSEGERGEINAVPEKEQSAETSDQIPIITLSEQDTNDIIRGINAPGKLQYDRFVDPYGFEDPLDFEFYDDIWFENARRNTDIFRMIFHTQPDDTVLSWKDYKQSSKLNRAFVLSQQQESKLRRQRHDFGRESLSDEFSNAESEFPISMDKRHSLATINVNKLDLNVGLLGHAPPSGGNDSEINSKKKFRGLNRKKDLPETVDEEDEKDSNESGKMSGASVNGENVSHASESGEKVPEAPELQGNGSVPKSGNKSRRRKRAGTFTARRKAFLGERIFERDSAERILSEVQGHLVLFPVDWLMRELDGGNWFYNTDRIPPIDIYS
jgi:phospholipase D1/2